MTDKDGVKETHNGVDGVLKTTDPSESDPCIDEKNGRKLFWENTERKLRDTSGLTRKGLYYVAGLLVAILVLFIIIVILGALWPSTPHHQQFPVCKNAACLEASAQIQGYMNESVSPCSNILSWACGRWFAQTSLPSDRSKWNQRHALGKQESARVRELVTTLPLPLHTGTVEWKLKHLYDACVEIDNVNSDQERPLTTIISELGKFELFCHVGFTMYLEDHKC